MLFQKVSSLALFFPANHEGASALCCACALPKAVARSWQADRLRGAGGELTVLERLAVFGVPVPNVRPARPRTHAAAVRGSRPSSHCETTRAVSVMRF